MGQVGMEILHLHGNFDCFNNRLPLVLSELISQYISDFAQGSIGFNTLQDVGH